MADDRGTRVGGETARTQREREFSRRELLRAGWSVPIALSLGAAAAASCGGESHGDGAHADHTDRGRTRGSSTTTSSTTTTSTTTTKPATTAHSDTHSDSPGPGHADAGPHGDHGDHGDMHGDTHGDLPPAGLHDDSFTLYIAGEPQPCPPELEGTGACEHADAWTDPHVDTHTDTHVDSG